MTDLTRISFRARPRILVSGLLAMAVLLSGSCSWGQQTSVDDSQAGPISDQGQSTPYPIQTQMAETSNQNQLNENADTSEYTDEAINHGPFFLSLEAMGIWTSNLQNTYENIPSENGAYVRLAAPAGVHLSTARSDFSAFFRIDSSLYPNNSDLNHTSEVYSHQFVHKYSDITTGSWSLAGGHVVTLGEYLAPIIGVGSTGVLAPQQTGGLQATNDAATTYTLAHQLNEHDTVTASGTVGWLDQPLLAASTSQKPLGAYRQITGGGDIVWQHALNSREFAGVELNNVYVKGLNPQGDSNFSAVKFTFTQTLTPHATFTGGIGPLYIHTLLPGFPEQDDFSYAANASVNYSQAIGRISASYARVYAVGYLSPSNVANELYLSFDRPITVRYHLTTDTQYIESSLAGQQTYGGYSQVGFTARVDMYLLHNFVYQIGASVFNQDGTSGIPGYNYNTFSGGFTYFFGHNPTAAEVQP